MSELHLDIEGARYTADLLETEASKSIDAMRGFTPLETEIMHVRWSGHAVWVNIDEVELPEIPRENHTVYPSRGDVLLYPGYRNEQEILIACGPTCFKSPAGELAGNHIGTLDATKEELVDLEEDTLTNGKKEVRITVTE